MATKMPTINQHEILHQHYPNDCCLCKAEQRIKDLENRIYKLELPSEPPKDERTLVDKIRKDSWYVDKGNEYVDEACSRIANLALTEACDIIDNDPRMNSEEKVWLKQAVRDRFLGKD